MGISQVLVGLTLSVVCQQPGAIEGPLRSVPPETLAREAREHGDARRGAIVFYRPTMTCTRCHVSETGTPSLGPDLSALGKDAKDAYIVESILEPSKEIRKGYETVTISTEDGRTLTGLLAEDREDAVVVRDPGQDGKPVTVRKDEIEERSDARALDHAGGPGEPAGRPPASFSTWSRYLMEIAEKRPGAGPSHCGPTRR